MNSRIVFISVILMVVGVTLFSFKPEQKSPPDGEEKDVTLVVSGQGKTIDEARQNALRSAIEQAFGTFISSNTTILNDSLVKDEIVSVSSGNIKNYETISEVQIPDGGYATTLKATVSVNKLTSFCESKGVEVEFKGSVFTANIKQQELNEKNEKTLLDNLLPTCEHLLFNSFDYSLSTGEPYLDEKQENYFIQFDVTSKANGNLKNYDDYLWHSIRGISMSKEEVVNYRKLNKKVFYVLRIQDEKETRDTIFLRSSTSFLSFSDILSLGKDSRRQFKIECQSDTILGPSLQIMNQVRIATKSGVTESYIKPEVLTVKSDLWRYYPKSTYVSSVYNYAQQNFREEDSNEGPCSVTYGISPECNCFVFNSPRSGGIKAYGIKVKTYSKLPECEFIYLHAYTIKELGAISKFTISRL